MDWGTHFILAAGILESCDCNKGATIYSVLPVIDRKPAHFHRVYAHILANQPKILDAAIEIFTGVKTGVDKDSYEYKRIKEDEEMLKGYLNESKKIIIDDAITKVTSDKVSAAVSLISHAYFDTFNNPVQMFLPESSLCSAQWDFWDNIDYLKFRSEFYEDKNIIPFREKMAKSSIWEAKPDLNEFPYDIRKRVESTLDKKLNPYALIKAMIIRVGEMAKPSISYNVIERGIRRFLRYLELDEYIRADREMQFCQKLEAQITKTIQEILND